MSHRVFMLIGDGQRQEAEEMADERGLPEWLSVLFCKGRYAEAANNRQLPMVNLLLSSHRLFSETHHL